MSDVSFATLLDAVRPLVAAARADDANPRFLLLPPTIFDAVAAARERDRALGVPATVLGLEIVRADEPQAELRVF